MYLNKYDIKKNVTRVQYMCNYTDKKKFKKITLLQ